MLYIVGSPIGNLKDITLRAIETLDEVDLILCENPEKTLKLIESLFKLNLIKSKKKILNFRRVKNLIEVLTNKKVAFLVSSGMPGVSDPVASLVKICIENKINFECIPGPSALTTVISLLPFQVKNLVFLGFLPKKEGKIKKFLNYFLKNKVTIIFFESPFRILKTLRLIEKILKDCKVEADFFIFKELTKINQRYYFGKIEKIIKEIEQNKIKGEWTVAIRSYGII